jgi:hypothetical protein
VTAGRPVVVGLVVIAAGSLLAVLLDRGEHGGTIATTVTVRATDTVTVPGTATDPAGDPGAGAKRSAEPGVPDSSQGRFAPRWRGLLRLNQTGHDLGGATGPSPQSHEPSVYVTGEGKIRFINVTVAVWLTDDKPGPRACQARVMAGGLSEGEADAIQPEASKQLCLMLTADDRSTRIGYMRIRSGFTSRAVNVDGVLWDVLP